MEKKKSNEPLVSVIIPVYNAEKIVGFTLDSVINQTYKNLEIILVDDGSLDKCGEICDDYAKKDNSKSAIVFGNMWISCTSSWNNFEYYRRFRVS